MVRFAVPKIAGLVVLATVFLWQAYQSWFRADRTNATKAALLSVIFGILAVIAIFFAVKFIDSGLWDTGNCPNVPVYEPVC